MKKFLTLLPFLISAKLFAQLDSAAELKEIKAFQDTLNQEYADKIKSPLEPKDLKRFKGHDFFPVDLKYRVKARFVRDNRDSVFTMKTSTDRRPEYVKFGEATFELNGKSYKLSMYQNVALRAKEEYKDYLFLPFNDLTNGKQSYGGGRFIDLKIPHEDFIIIDFNQSYNPLCAYNHKYSCPVPPVENRLNVEVRAGVRLVAK